MRIAKDAPFAIALDQGTTGTSLHRLNLAGEFETGPSFEHRQIFPHPGWVEHDPLEILRHLETAIAAGKGARAIGLANQGETVVAWDARDKRPLYNAIVWQDARTAPMIADLAKAGHGARIRAATGLPLDPYFSASKLRWLFDHAPDAKSLHREGRLRLGTSDSFFLDRLAGRFVTDVATASRTSLMNLGDLAWDPDLCDLFGVPIECLPEIVTTTGEIGAIADCPVTAISVDQQAALFGHGCRRPGDTKFTFGTGAFALTLTGKRPILDAASGLLPTIAWKLAGADPVYALDGGIYNASSAIDWARGLGLFADFAEIADFGDRGLALARDLVFVPALSGLGAPYWDRSAAGLWLGLGLETTKLDLMQALLEGIACRARQILLAMDLLQPIGGDLSIDGGLSANPYFRRILADFSGRPLRLPATAELTGFGIAALALIGAGLGKPEDQALFPPAIDRILPQREIPADLFQRFDEALSRARQWRKADAD